MKIRIFFSVLCLFCQVTLGQNMKTLGSEGKLKKTNHVLADVITVIPKGKQVKIISGPVNGIYSVEYNGIQGYLNEIAFITPVESYTTSNYSGSVPYYTTIYGTPEFFSSSSSNSSSSNNSASQDWNINYIKERWKREGMDNIEGIYESIGSYIDKEVPCMNGYGQTICYMTWRLYESNYKLALVKRDGEYKLIYLSGSPKNSEKVSGCNCDGKTYIPVDPSPWQLGDTKAKLHKTATKNVFKCDWLMSNKVLDSDTFLSIENPGYFTVLMSGNKTTYIKSYPTSDENTSSNSTDNKTKSSGTGYAISSNGYILTNHHVTNGSSFIRVKGINGDFSYSYQAKIVIEDKNNDLSIIKIDDSKFTNLGIIPYVINSRTMDVGSTVFVLGYPLRASMGDEVKLTNGIISSKSGFQGDVSSYQISAPVQPGNSGGPLFDERGNIIGIINAKHTEAENASYAIKASYILNLIDLLPVSLNLQTINSVMGKPLTEQVKILKKFTYIIEVN